MKSLLISAVLLFSVVSFSADTAATLRYFRISDCTSWSNLPGSYSMYGCSFYPTSQYVPEINSLVSILTAQENLIKSLEARIQALEQKN